MSCAYPKPDTCWQHGGALTWPMPDRAPAPPATARPRSPRLAAALVVSATLTGILVGCQSLAPSSARSLPEVPSTVANLDPDLLGAVRRAATDAAADGVELRVTSGWRSARYQDHLLREAVARYGSAKEAARWVATAKTSRHVSGDAVDIGPAQATAWLAEHGAEYGLCRVYDNEPWHYELRPDAIDDGCPARYADPTQDPRMRQH